MSHWHDFFAATSILFGVFASGLGILAATTEVRDNQDKFIDDLKLQGRRASGAAICAALSSIALAVEYLTR
jgi:hypothetical protein